MKGAQNLDDRKGRRHSQEPQNNKKGMTNDSD